MVIKVVQTKIGRKPKSLGDRGTPNQYRAYCSECGASNTSSFSMMARMGIRHKPGCSHSKGMANRNSKSFMNEKMVGGKWEGIYELESGAILEAHEWEDGDWDEYDEDERPEGAVYYDIYENGEAVDGGVCGYSGKDKFSDIARFVKEGNKETIIRKVVAADDPNGRDLYEAMYDPGDYAKVKSMYGLKNLKALENRKRGKGKMKKGKGPKKFGLNLKRRR